MNNNLLLEGLNNSQQEAVKSLEGPLLILAGAGSGKTKTLTHRIANLIHSGVAGRSILSVTFTNKAAGEMKERIIKILSSLLQDNTGMPMMGTFHSICVRMLREDIEKLDVGLSKNFVIFDSNDMQSLIKLILKERQVDDKKFKPRAVLSHISKAKNQLITPSGYFESVEDNQFTRVIRDLYPIYQKKLIEHNALDFDDLLQKTVQLLEYKPEILEKYQNRWKYVMVDEYQDTNFAQYRMIRLLTNVHQNLCVVGDDHQSIYAFRGADFRNILDFEKDFPKAKVVKLEQNYRSTKNILANANCLISFNTTGREKKLWTDNPAGNKIQVVETFDEKSEGKFIAEKIKELNRSGGNYKECAILYRMNAQSRAMEENLMRNQIPYQIIGGTRFFDRKEIKDVIAYLRLIFNPRDDVSFLRIINTPARKIGPATLEVVKTYAQNYTMSLFEILEGIGDVPELNAKKKEVLFSFYRLIGELQKIAEKEPVSILLHRIIEKIDFLKFLEDGTEEGESRAQNVRELFSVATRYDAVDNSLAAFLEGVALISDLDNMDKQDSVTLMTVHASKGLEFPNVFLSGWEENIFPSASSQQDPRQLEEERRLGYVAITRAEKQAFISFARQRMLFGQTQSSMPSQFIGQLDPSCIEKDQFGGGQTPAFSRGKNFSGKNYLSGSSYTAPQANVKSSVDELNAASPQLLKKQAKNKQEAVFGQAAMNHDDYTISDKIVHEVYGEGTIIMIAGDVLSVAFAGKGLKKILASSSPISKV